MLHELCGDTPEETINNFITIFCACLTEAIVYKIAVDELNGDEAKDFIHSVFGASISSQQLAKNEILEMVI